MGVNYETYGEKGKRYLINDGRLMINLFGDCTDRCIREYLDSIMVSRKKSKNTPTKLKFTVLLASG